jgi:small subunit ribosomal protein S16
MVVIRMKRAGAKKRPFYRVVVADSRSPRDGRYIEQLGYYDPLTDPATFKVDTDKFAGWIRRGATPSESVGVMMAKHAPEALRPAPLIAPETAAAVTAPTKEERKAKKQEVKKAKAAAKKGAKKGAAKKKAPKAATHKGGEKKAKARAKKKSGVAPKRAVKKAKKKKS